MSMDTFPKCLPLCRCASASFSASSGYTLSTTGRIWLRTMALHMAMKSSRLPTVTPCRRTARVTTSPRGKSTRLPPSTPMRLTVPSARTARSYCANVSPSSNSTTWSTPLRPVQAMARALTGRPGAAGVGPDAGGHASMRLRLETLSCTTPDLNRTHCPLRTRATTASHTRLIAAGCSAPAAPIIRLSWAVNSFAGRA